MLLGATYKCEKCGRVMDENNFYTYKDGTKTELCKKCLTMHVDNFNPDTFLWLMEKMDVPYIPGEWNILRDKIYARNPLKMNGMSVFGRYLSKMKLKQWSEYHWADSERLTAESEDKGEEKAEELEAQKKYEDDLKQQFENGEISEAQYKTLAPTKALRDEEKVISEIELAKQEEDNPFKEEDFLSEDDLIDPAAELTQDDKIYLAMKWGRLYRPNEWVELEKKYNEMIASFDIQDADTISTLILICKTDLKMNQAIDIGDLDGYQKLSRVYDSLRKSARFTAAQNKEAKDDFVDSIGELVAECEREGFIARFATDIPQDKIDVTLKDMNNYVKKLVTQDLGFGQQIEDSLKKLQIQKEMRDSDDGFNFDDENELNTLADIDYEDFYDEIEEQKNKDLQLLELEE